MGSTLARTHRPRLGSAALTLGLFGAHRARAFEGDARPGTEAGRLSVKDLTCRTPAEIRALAFRHGFEGNGRRDVAGHYRKFQPIRDPATGNTHFPLRFR